MEKVLLQSMSMSTEKVTNQNDILSRSFDFDDDEE